MKILYMKVTKDKYELPVAVADSIPELARMCGVTENSIKSFISHEKAGRKKSVYKKVIIDDD